MRLTKLISYLKFNLFFIYNLIPYYFNFLKFSNLNKNYFVFSEIKFFNFLIFFFKKNSLLRLSSISDLTVVDLYTKKNRFKLIYNLVSLSYGFRVFFNFFLKESRMEMPSLKKIFKGANWLEREAWDLFGIFFVQHNDLRRILTDYGFKGYPFRKDFPLTGYIELRFDDTKKNIVYEPLELSQSFRFYNFSSSWELDY